MTAAALCVCLAAFLCACGKATDAETTTEPEITSPWSEAQVFTLPADEETSAADGETAEEDVILNRIETARAVYGLFTESRPQLDKEDSIEVEEGLFAYRVVEPKLDTWDKLKAYVSGYFSAELTQQLLNVGIFTDYEGKLYAVDVGMQSTTTGEKHVEVTEKTDTSESYRLTITGETEKTYNYVYAKQADGKWVFTRFERY